MNMSPMIMVIVIIPTTMIAMVVTTSFAFLTLATFADPNFVLETLALDIFVMLAFAQFPISSHATSAIKMRIDHFVIHFFHGLFSGFGLHAGCQLAFANQCPTFKHLVFTATPTLILPMMIMMLPRGRPTTMQKVMINYKGTGFFKALFTF